MLTNKPYFKVLWMHEYIKMNTSKYNLQTNITKCVNKAD